MKSLRYIGTFALLAMFAACSTEEVQLSFSENEVKVNATIGSESIFTRSYPTESNAEDQKVFKEQDQIGISMNGGIVHKYAKNNDIFVSTDENGPLKWETEATEFKAFYPYSTGTDADSNNSFDKGHIIKKQDSEAGLALADYMKVTKKYDAIPENRQLDLTFERKTARVIVDIQNSTFTNEFNSPSVTEVTIFSKLDIPATQDAKAEEITPYKMEDKNPKSSWMALVAPNAEDANKNFICIKVKEDNSTYDTAKPYYVKGIPNLEGGKSYTYKLKIGKDKVTIESVTVAEWTEGTVISGGEAIAVVTKEDVKKSIETQLTNDNKDIVLTLNSNPSTDIFTEIKNSLANESGINLTLKGVEAIQENTFYEVTWLNKITLPNTVTIGENAFSGSSLTDIEAPNVNTVEILAFSECKKLKDVNLPKVSKIDTRAFYFCSNLKTVRFGTLTEVWTETEYNNGGIFMNVDTPGISLTLSSTQRELKMREEEAIFVWRPSSGLYKGSSDYMRNQFLNYTFAEVECVD